MMEMGGGLMMWFQWQEVDVLRVCFQSGSYLTYVCNGEGAAFVYILMEGAMSMFSGGTKWKRGLQVGIQWV